MGAGGGASGGTGGAVGMDYAASVLMDRPLAYYRLGESVGLFAINAAGPEKAIYSGVDLGQTGAIAGDPNTAIRLRGMPGSNVALGDRFDFAGKAVFTFELWVRPNQVDAETRRIVDKSTPNGGYDAVFNDNGLIFYRSDMSSNNADLATLHSVPLHAYSHVVVTFDGTELKIYQDGNEAESGPAMATLPDTMVPLTFGDGFDGDFDELAIYDHALDPGRIAAHYLAARGSAAP